MTQGKVIYIAIRVPANNLSGDNFDVAVSWSKKDAVEGARDDYLHLTPRERKNIEYLLYGRECPLDVDDAAEAWREMCLEWIGQEDDAIVESSALRFDESE